MYSSHYNNEDEKDEIKIFIISRPQQFLILIVILIVSV